MRYPNVLFDLDGTLIDSGAIILASFQHATRTVLRREIPGTELAALVGGSNIYDQMRGIDELQAEELVRVYREHNEPLHDQLETFEGIEHVLAELKRQGRRLGIVTAKRRKTVELAFVGDSPFDVGAGKAAGVLTVAVAWGNIHPVGALVEADALVQSPEELLDVL
jgi:phosphoglycolate phosphatase-like HAD superfamily hydrolase